jgi:hypothetical protein
MSECDHNCETRNAEPEKGTDGSGQLQPNLWVSRYGSGLGLQRVRGSAFWPGLEPYGPICRSKPELLAGYPDRLLTIDMRYFRL